MARRISRKLWRLKKARQGKQIRQTRKLKQKGGYVPYRGNPVGGVYVNPLAWDE